MLNKFLTFFLPFAAAFLLVVYAIPFAPEDFKVRVWVVVSIAGAAIIALLSSRTRLCIKPVSFRFDRDRWEKCLALLVAWFFVLIVSMLEVQMGVASASSFFDDFLRFFPLPFVVIPLYVALVESSSHPKADAYNVIGAALVGRRPFVWRECKTLVLSWVIKAFFIPLMYGFLIDSLLALLKLGVLPSSSTWISWLFFVGISIDLLIAATGYLCTGKLFNSEIISVDDRWLGWMVCLTCYPPFSQFSGIFTAQVDNAIWTDWLSPSEPLYWIWATLIVATWGVYWLSSVAFGFYFSNLSYRGLIDIGPYRFCKHPGYLSKNIYWWLHTVPFFGVFSAGDMARNFAGLALTSLIYYLRAKTEERHLSRYPEYIAYSKRIDARWLGFKNRILFRTQPSA